MNLIRAFRNRLSSRKPAALIDPRDFQPPLPVPKSYTRGGLLAALETASIDGSAIGEMSAYVQADIERFIHTLGLVPADMRGSALEIGANPYFMTLMFRKFRPGLDFSLVNYFGGDTHQAVQRVAFSGFDDDPQYLDLTYTNTNLEMTQLPYPTDSFDLVVFCEVLEHLTTDPMHAMLELRRVLKPGGRLVLTTPNATRLENVSAFVEGRNIYDPYSKYGPYGRHNREYTRHELVQLLSHCGFETEICYTANVHDDIPPHPAHIPAINAAIASVENRSFDLGQYLFSSSISKREAQALKPAWLFRSYPPEEVA